MFIVALNAQYRPHKIDSVIAVSGEIKALSQQSN